MIFDISDRAFKKIFDDERLCLPKRWDGADFKKELESLFQHYDHQLTSAQSTKASRSQIITISDVREVATLLVKTVREYLNGYPARAYACFSTLMEKMIKIPLNIHNHSREPLYYSNGKNNEHMILFRVVKVEDNKPYQRARMFHPPYNMRSKVSTNRYSIAGYPSLYLGSSLQLCCDEIKAVPQKDMLIASAFRVDEQDLLYNKIQVIDLSIKPQDFFEQGDDGKGRFIPAYMLTDDDIRLAYLLWYPLIAACSYIRVNKQDPFAAEYIVPQLLMQWIHENTASDPDLQLTGIRYFSCASVRASDMGFNYVFPTSGESHPSENQYCKYLVKTFALTEPVYLHEYGSIEECETELEHRECVYLNNTV